MDPIPRRPGPMRDRALAIAAATVILALVATATPASAEDVFVPIPVHVPVDFKIVVTCDGEGCVMVRSQPCVGLVVGNLGFVLVAERGLFIQQPTTDPGPTLYVGYHELCEGRETVDVSYLESLG